MAKRQTKQTSKSKRIRPGDPGWEWDIYDPPEGWRWGFPKPYRPLPGEDLK